MKSTQDICDQQYMNELNSLKSDNELINNSLKEKTEILENRIKEIQFAKEVLINILPNFDSNSDNWMTTIESAFNELINQQKQQLLLTNEQNSQKIDEFESLFKNEQQKNSELELKILHYTKTLSEMETILSNLQNKIEKMKKKIGKQKSKSTKMRQIS